MRSRVLMLAAQVGTVVALISLWQWAASSGHLNTFLFGKPSEIWEQLVDQAESGKLWHVHIWTTMKILVIGYSIGVAVGTALGCLIGGSKLARAVLEPFVIFLNAMPRLILFPFFVVWLGFGNAPKVLTVMLVIVTIVMVNVAAGVREVQGTYLETVRALGAGRLHVIKQVYVPSLSLWLLSTSRVSMGYAFQAAITAQFVGAQEGLGYLVNYGRQRLDVDLVYAAIFIILAIALIIDTSLRIVERRVTRWMPERS